MILQMNQMGQQAFKELVKKTDLKQKCSKCKFYSKSEVQLKKHKNTKLAKEHMEASIEEEGDFYQYRLLF